MAEPVVIGGAVWYVALDGGGQMALVNGILKRPGRNPYLNLTIVSKDHRKRDDYGQQNEARITGVPHEEDSAEGGHYYRPLWPCEPK